MQKRSFGIVLEGNRSLATPLGKPHPLSLRTTHREPQRFSAILFFTESPGR
jgi:hypothetical protein